MPIEAFDQFREKWITTRVRKVALWVATGSTLAGIGLTVISGLPGLASWTTSCEVTTTTSTDNASGVQNRHEESSTVCKAGNQFSNVMILLAIGVTIGAIEVTSLGLSVWVRARADSSGNLGIEGGIGSEPMSASSRSNSKATSGESKAKQASLGSS